MRAPSRSSARRRSPRRRPRRRPRTVRRPTPVPATRPADGPACHTRGACWKAGTVASSRRLEVARLIYSAIASLDGYIEDSGGEIGWAAPDAEVLAFVNDLERPIGTYLYGRRMYDTMAYWETEGASADDTAESRDFSHVSRAAEKVVYSRALAAPSTVRTRIERDF